MAMNTAPRDVLVIGGNRYVGKRLIARLLAAGDRVTVLNRGSSPVPPGAAHVVADRNDERALTEALAGRTFDVVVDQVCYTPRQAETARRVFAGRTGRYLMTSTVEVYGHLDAVAPLPESAVDPRTVTVDPELPWADPEFLDRHYGEGKRQAEAVFAASDLPHVSVRVAHVLGGTDDFTGRLRHYADRIMTGTPVAVPPVSHPATYIHVEEIADFLFWAAGEDFTGPVNAASHGELTVGDLCTAVATRLGAPEPEFKRTESEATEVSPFAFRRHYAMDNSRAERLGFTFSDVREWLPKAVSETLSSY
ncbi:NAD-dependent epimerase/dehydratase family protein [Streptomyces sp. NPDC020192]|uniref:NAD-dependent epimerase/dehydratase family protein n=1 Tax=Streptomyces sp. NPDC020192 TaxID=3365066 RepID=UPI00379A0CF3